jgi:hypothetical protein
MGQDIVGIYVCDGFLWFLTCEHVDNCDSPVDSLICVLTHSACAVSSRILEQAR